MNWDMVGALGELVGALAVVLTLIYLGRQVRQASEEAQRNRFGNLNDEISRVADSWGSEDALSDIVFRGLQDPLSLTPHEAFRFNSSVFRMFKAWESVFQYASEGGVPQWGAEILGRPQPLVFRRVRSGGGADPAYCFTDLGGVLPQVGGMSGTFRGHHLTSDCYCHGLPGR